VTEPGLDLLLLELEKKIGVLAAGTAPLDALVEAHQQASKLLVEARARLEDLKARADDTAQLLSE